MRDPNETLNSRDWAPLFAAFAEVLEWLLDRARDFARQYPEEVAAVERVRGFVRKRIAGHPAHARMDDLLFVLGLIAGALEQQRQQQRARRVRETAGASRQLSLPATDRVQASVAPAPDRGRASVVPAATDRARASVASAATAAAATRARSAPTAIGPAPRCDGPADTGAPIDGPAGSGVLPLATPKPRLPTLGIKRAGTLRARTRRPAP